MRSFATRFGLATALLWLSATVANAQDPAKEIDPKVVEAWQQAGAKVGWQWIDEQGEWQFSETRPKGRALPAFFWMMMTFNLEPITKPTVPFALSIKYRLTALPSSGAMLQPLANLKCLRALDLTRGPTCDEGLKVLATSKSLRILYIQHTPVTDTGVADLRKVRPDLKIDR